jgi:hypothetical protein
MGCRGIHLLRREVEIERVRSLSGDALRRRWRAVFGRSPPLAVGLDRDGVAPAKYVDR